MGCPHIICVKKDWTLRLCIRFCKLKKVTRMNKYPLSITKDFFDKLKGMSYFSKIDLRTGYHQLSVI